MKRFLALLTIARMLVFFAFRKIVKTLFGALSFLVPALKLRQGGVAHKAVRSLRLRHQILVCVLASILITECLVIGISYVMWTGNQFGRLDQETLLMLKANVDSTSFLSVNETLRMGERISGFSNVRGGTIYNRLGQDIASFGMHPALSMLTFERENRRHYVTQDQAFLDMYYPTELTGLAHPMVLRIDAKRVPQILKETLKEKAWTTLMIAFLSAIAIVFLLSMTVIGPVLKLREAVLQATDNPNMADRAKLNWKRGDEFGDVARALDMLFTGVSTVYQEDLAAMQEATQQTAIAMLTYDAGSHLINANTAAMRLFGISLHDNMRAISENFIRRFDGASTKDISPLDLLTEDPPIKTVNVITNSGLKRCLMNGVVVHKRNGMPLRTIISLIDVTKSAKEKEDFKTEALSLKEKNIALTRRTAEMRNLFQSCMILLSTPQQPDEIAADAATPEGKRARGAVVLTDRFVNAWYQEARRAHLIDSELEHGVLPPVYGAPEQVEAIFRQAFMAVYSQAQNEKPVICIVARPAGSDQHCYEVYEQPNIGAQRALDETLIAGAKLSLASLRRSVQAIGGRMEEAEPGRVRFTLYTASFGDVEPDWQQQASAFAANRPNEFDNSAEALITRHQNVMTRRSFFR